MMDNIMGKMPKLPSRLRVPTSVPKLLCFLYNYRSTRGKQLSDFEWRWGVWCGNVGFIGEGRRDREENCLHNHTTPTVLAFWMCPAAIGTHRLTHAV